MTYITTYHPFVIDEKHPTDVFDEMSNFFSLYTVTLDAFHQLSIGLTVPSDFDIDSNAKLHTAYQNFIKAVRYSIPDANVLAVAKADDNSHVKKGMLELMIQYHEGRMVQSHDEAETKPKFYQKILGVMLPKFDSTQEATGVYPAQPVRPEPAVPMSIPVAVPVPSQPIPRPVVSQPAPTVAQQPNVQPQYQSPQYQPQYQAPQNPPITQPQSQPQAMPTIPPVVVPIPQSVQQPTPSVAPQPTPINYLPKPNISIKPYRELLTQAIIEQATQDKSANTNPQPISEITLKSKDSLTTALIETLFASFDKSLQTGQQAYDAIDLGSYGLEELRPQLQKIGVAISDEAQFALNAKAKATAQDLEKIRQGRVNPADIHLATQLNYSEGSVASTQYSHETANLNQNTNQITQTPTPLPIATHPANANALNLAINIKVSDNMGERTVKLREFPAVFSTQNSHSSATKLIKVMTSQLQGELFYLTEQDGQLLAKNVTQGISLNRNGQARDLKENDILLPNDVLHLGQDVKIALLLN